MAALKSLASLSWQAAAAALLVLLAVAALQTKTANAQPQSCTTELTNLNVCAPFVVPGAGQAIPTPDCCGALQAVQHECLCSTLRIASQLPSRCNLPALDCGTEITACIMMP
ncbi:hypothetical protein DITRI_Ditri04bG0182300 [Diplodiscus trichospermus]